LRCGRCGNENAEANRFCGMCGATLVRNTSAPNQASVVVPAGSPAAPRPAAIPVAPVPVPPAPKQADPAPLPAYRTERSSKPVISGPSFLGLSTPGPHVERHSERDPLRPSSNLDYLLEDEEEPPRGGGKLILVVVALALAAGFGYLHWKQGGFNWLNAGDKKPIAAKPTPDAAPGTDSGSTAGTTTPAPGASDAGTTPADTVAGQATAPQTSSPATATPVGALPDAAQNAAQSTPSQGTPAQTAPAQVTPAQISPAQNQAADPNLPAGTATPDAGPDPNQRLPPAAVPSIAKTAARKPSPARPVAAKPVDAVADAERYIYGRGVQQDCDRGLHLLKPAAEQSNAKAMISLGGLYSTGTCTPRDLPTAYRWFALALHKEPDNQALQDNLQKLWSQMTQPERQLAIRLSQ
jgi:hypothetical protein